MLEVATVNPIASRSAVYYCIALRLEVLVRKVLVEHFGVFSDFWLLKAFKIHIKAS